MTSYLKLIFSLLREKSTAKTILLALLKTCLANQQKQSNLSIFGSLPKTAITERLISSLAVESSSSANEQIINVIEELKSFSTLIEKNDELITCFNAFFSVYPIYVFNLVDYQDVQTRNENAFIRQFLIKKEVWSDYVEIANQGFLRIHPLSNPHDLQAKAVARIDSILNVPLRAQFISYMIQHLQPSSMHLIGIFTSCLSDDALSIAVGKIKLLLNQSQVVKHIASKTLGEIAKKLPYEKQVKLNIVEILYDQAHSESSSSNVKIAAFKSLGGVWPKLSRSRYLTLLLSWLALNDYKFHALEMLCNLNPSSIPVQFNGKLKEYISQFMTDSNPAIKRMAYDAFACHAHLFDAKEQNDCIAYLLSLINPEENLFRLKALQTLIKMRSYIPNDIEIQILQTSLSLLKSKNITSDEVKFLSTCFANKLIPLIGPDHLKMVYEILSSHGLKYSRERVSFITILSTEEINSLVNDLHTDLKTMHDINLFDVKCLEKVNALIDLVEHIPFNNRLGIALDLLTILFNPEIQNFSLLEKAPNLLKQFAIHLHFTDRVTLLSQLSMRVANQQTIQEVFLFLHDYNKREIETMKKERLLTYSTALPLTICSMIVR